jgi:hypothetical protein
LELFHRLDREAADAYLQGRAAKGFAVIQAVALAELKGLQNTNPYRYLPLIKEYPGGPMKFIPARELHIGRCRPEVPAAGPEIIGLVYGVSQERKGLT